MKSSDIRGCKNITSLNPDPKLCNSRVLAPFGDRRGFTAAIGFSVPKPETLNPKPKLWLLGGWRASHVMLFAVLNPQRTSQRKVTAQEAGIHNGITSKSILFGGCRVFEGFSLGFNGNSNISPNTQKPYRNLWNAVKHPHNTPWRIIKLL